MRTRVVSLGAVIIAMSLFLAWMLSVFFQTADIPSRETIVNMGNGMGQHRLRLYFQTPLRVGTSALRVRLTSDIGSPRIADKIELRYSPVGEGGDSVVEGSFENTGDLEVPLYLLKRGQWELVVQITMGRMSVGVPVMLDVLE